MIKDDVTGIETGASCYVLNNATSIYSYKGGTRKTYYEIGGKWYYAAQSAYNTLPNNAVCISYSSIEGLSHFSYMEPVYLSFCLIFSLFIFIGAFYLLFGKAFKRRL